MLNRTNRTLSANTNRLNLGTRTLAIQANGNIGSLTLRTTHSRFMVVVVRTGVVGYPGIPVEEPSIKAEPKRMKPAMMVMPGSSPDGLMPSQGIESRRQGQVAELPLPAVRPAVVLRDAVGTGRGDVPQVSQPLDRSRSNLGWPGDSRRRAGRSVRTALALITGSTPSS